MIIINHWLICTKNCHDTSKILSNHDSYLLSFACVNQLHFTHIFYHIITRNYIAKSFSVASHEKKSNRVVVKINIQLYRYIYIFTCVSDKFRAWARAFLSAPTTYWLLSNACSNFSNWPGENAVRTRFGFRNGCSKKSVKKKKNKK